MKIQQNNFEDKYKDIETDTVSKWSHNHQLLVDNDYEYQDEGFKKAKSKNEYKKLIKVQVQNVMYISGLFSLHSYLCFHHIKRFVTTVQLIQQFIEQLLMALKV